MFPRETLIGAAGCICEEAIDDNYFKSRKVVKLVDKLAFMCSGFMGEWRVRLPDL